MEMNLITRNAVTEYRVNLKGVMDQFMGSIIEVDSNQPEQKILEEIARILFMKKSMAPTRPPKVILMGPPGVEIDQYAKMLCNQYRLVDLDGQSVVQEFIKKQGANANDLKQLLKNGERIPDDIVLDLLKQRLSLPDARIHGWIIKGAPSGGKVIDDPSDEQIQMLKELEQQPNIIITMEMSDNLIYEKLEQRRFDPVTNRHVFVMNENISDQNVLNRLVHSPEDTHSQIKKKLMEYRAFKHLMDSEFSSIMTRISAEQDNAAVFKSMV